MAIGVFVALVLACGAYVKARTSESFAALDLALFNACQPSDERDDKTAVVKDLLAKGANPKALFNGMSAIHGAAQWSLPLVQLLVDAGASIDGEGGERTTLDVVCKSKNAVAMIPQLVKLGASDVSQGTVWPLFVDDECTYFEYLDAAAHLLQVGCGTWEIMEFLADKFFSRERDGRQLDFNDFMVEVAYSLKQGGTCTSVVLSPQVELDLHELLLDEYLAIRTVSSTELFFEHTGVTF